MVIHDCQEWDGSPVALSPRGVLRKVLENQSDAEVAPWQPYVDLVRAA